MLGSVNPAAALGNRMYATGATGAQVDGDVCNRRRRHTRVEDASGCSGSMPSRDKDVGCLSLYCAAKRISKESTRRAAGRWNCLVQTSDGVCPSCHGKIKTPVHGL